jgi:RND family efflux transporter MFP subunit
VPFDGVVISESVDAGQYVSPGQPVARVYGTDAVEVRLPLENRELAWFSVPEGPAESGPEAVVEASIAGRTHAWQGRVVRMEAEVDTSSRMVNVVVEVRDPFDRGDDRPPLLPGTFVDVRVAGRTVEGLVAIPRYAVHEGDRVWVVDEGILTIRDVDVVRSDRDQAFIGNGLDDGDLIVVSSLDAVTDGMTVRPAGLDVQGETETTKISALAVDESRLGLESVRSRQDGSNLQSSIFDLQSGGVGRSA